MVKEMATVVAVDGDKAWVETTRQSSCGSCESSSGCGTATFSKVLGNRPFRVQVENPLHAKIGEQVIIAISENSLMKGAVLLYMIPLLALFLFALIGQWVMANWFGSVQEWVTVVAGAAGAYAVVLWMKSKGWFEQQEMVPVITEVKAQYFVTMD
ncbi:MAG: SoxR reducing system RseC family protein [Gammaproteobacteria bacterium]|uniref:SoxR reducing system RseC family protein n=1 Tax=Candidatus Thiopontia autotrophica TaxID=2841688 RepID=A0A8J6P491_9GAMM|nr:SoxR reducing system RseC family protein [Candidatus Thiopontia autotrophica]MBL6968968.1 SoxR reducing system RseC family protein [Gammaproteobacteria bacterium]